MNLMNVQSNSYSQFPRLGPVNGTKFQGFVPNKTTPIIKLPKVIKRGSSITPDTFGLVDKRIHDQIAFDNTVEQQTQNYANAEFEPKGSYQTTLSYSGTNNLKRALNYAVRTSQGGFTPQRRSATEEFTKRMLSPYELSNKRNDTKSTPEWIPENLKYIPPNQRGDVANELSSYSKSPIKWENDHLAEASYTAKTMKKLPDLHGDIQMDGYYPTPPLTNSDIRYDTINGKPKSQIMDEIRNHNDRKYERKPGKSGTKKG